MIQFSPLLPCTLALILGIIWQAIGMVPWLALVFLSIMVVAFFARHYTYATVIAVATTFFIAGALRYEQQKNSFEQFIQTGCDTSCALTASVDDIEVSYRSPGVSILTVTIVDMQHKNISISAANGFQLKIATKQPVDHLHPGDIISCPKIFLRAPTHESYKRYLIKEHLAGHATTQRAITVLQRPTYSVTSWLAQQRNAVLQQAHAKLSPTTFTLFASIFWGKKELDAYYMNPIKEQFKIWGILHYLARSGLHVLLFVILWAWLLAWLPLPFAIKQIILTLLIMSYHLLSWPSVSFMRSLVMFLCYKACCIYNLQINVLHLLALTCMGILLINPFQLFFLDFQLSFGLTFALAWLTMLQKQKLLIP